MDGSTNECPNCDVGTLSVYSTRVDKQLQLRTRYTKCRHCGYTPSQPMVIPLTVAPRKSRERIRMQRLVQQRMF